MKLNSGLAEEEVVPFIKLNPAVLGVHPLEFE
jgi:hypothetical protein